MPRYTGRRVALSLPRRWIDDLMWASRGRPIITFERRMPLAALAEPRSLAGVSWSVLFAKAFGAVCANRAEMRRMLMPLPWPHVFECSEVAMTYAVEREFQQEPAVFFGLFRNPQNQSLQALQSAVGHWRTAPVENVPDFHRLIRYSRLPRFIRRAIWCYGLNATGGIRVRNFGTCGMSVTASAGATATNLIAPVATTLNYGTFDENHQLDVRLHFDHRLLDGMTAARVLAEIEAELHGPVLAELNAMATPQRAATTSKPC